VSPGMTTQAAARRTSFEGLLRSIWTRHSWNLRARTLFIVSGTLFIVSAAGLFWFLVGLAVVDALG